MNDPSDTVVAIVDDHEEALSAAEALAREEFDAEVMAGEEGLARLRGDDPEAPSALKSMALAMGDAVRIEDRLQAALERGWSVISVRVGGEAAARAAEILQDHGGHDMWRLGEWSFNRIGEEGSGEG